MLAKKRYILLIVFLFFCACFFPVKTIAQINSDSLARVVGKTKGKQKVLTLSDISFGYAYTDHEKCLLFARKTLAEAKKLKNDTLVSEGMNAMAIAFYVNHNFDSSIHYNFKALDIRKKLKDGRGQASSLSKIANIYTDQGKYPEAIKIHQQLLDLFTKEKDKDRYAATLINIANAYSYAKDAPKAEKYSRLSMKTVPDVKDPMIVARIYGNMANYLEKNNVTDSALYYNQIALTIFLKEKNYSEASGIYNNLGITYRKLGNHQLALENYQKAYDIAKSYNDPYNTAYYGANTAFFLIKNGDPQKAEKLLNEAKGIAEGSNNLFLRQMVYGNFSLLKEKQGNAIEALRYQKLYNNVKDSLLNIERTKAIEEMEARFQNERQLNINKALELDKKTEQLKREKAETASANKSKYIFILSLGSAIVLLVVLFFYQRRQRKLNEEHNKQIIHEKELGLRAVFDATEEERKRIAKDLHDGIGQQMSGLKLAWQSVSSDISSTNPTEKERLGKLTAVLDETSKEIRDISHRMMPRALTEMGLKEAIGDMLKKTLEHSTTQYQFESFGLQGQRFDEKIEISLYRICQELVNNVVKHAHATHLSVQLITKGSYVVLIVEDDGKGFDHQGKQGGIGLMNINSRVNTVNGKINYEASRGAGTVVTVRVPVKPR